MKKIKNILILSIVLLGALNLSSCKDDPKPHYTVSRETLDYCVFQNDTRWIYEEESSTLWDTLTVYEYAKNFADYAEERQYTNDIYIYKLKSSILGFGVNDFYEFLVYPEHKYASGIDVSQSFGPYTSGLGPIEYFAATDTGDVFEQYANTQGMKYAEYYDSLNIDGRKYYQVKVFEYLTTFGEAYPKKIYWARHIGRIRYELWNGEVWNLIEYTIKQ